MRFLAVITDFFGAFFPSFVLTPIFKVDFS